MMLAKVKEQDGIMLANVKVPSIPTSAACCDDVQLTKAESSSYIPFTTVNCLSYRVLQNTDTSSYIQLSTTSSDCVLQTQLPAAYLQLSTTSSDCVLLNTDTSSYSKPSITSSDCVLQTQIPLVIHNRQLLHRTASSFKPLM